MDIGRTVELGPDRIARVVRPVCPARPRPYVGDTHADPHFGAKSAADGQPGELGPDGGAGDPGANTPANDAAILDGVPGDG